MNYLGIYGQLITRGKSRELIGYKEKHHIVPTCLGGPNIAENIVKLTAREHFLAHWLLHRIHPTNPKLAHAFFFMCNSKHHRISSRAYEEAKIGHLNAVRKKTISEEHRLAISKANKGRRLSDKEKLRVSEVHKGKKLSEDHIRRMKLSQKGKVISHEVKLRMAAGCLNKAKLTCPYCGKIGQNSNMKAHHFDHCKLKVS